LRKNRVDLDGSGTWAAVVFAGASHRLCGAAAAIDHHRVISSGSVYRAAGEHEEITVSFPRSFDAPSQNIRVKSVTIGESDHADVVVMTLAEPIPDDVDVALLRQPRPNDLVGKAWRAFGFPANDVIGNEVTGVVGAILGYGWVRLDVTSRDSLESGFRGAAIWSPDYKAVVGIVGDTQDGDGRAITLSAAARALPGEQLEALAEWSASQAPDSDLATWGWELASDQEGPRHWNPRSRGVTTDSEIGYRFRGRQAALTEIIRWLSAPAIDRRALLVTGSPGVGKSAVLGRIVTTADPAFAQQLPSDDSALRAPPRSIACAVHVKGKTALDVGQEMARAASARLPERLEDVVTSIRTVLANRSDKRLFVVVVDALDEASTTEDARAIAASIVLPLAENCADVGAKVLVGTRRRDAVGGLIEAFGPAKKVIDLDSEEYFSLGDLEAYALATLQLLGDERAGNPYVDGKVARPVARQIAALAGRNFLVAGLVARTHALHDREPVRPRDVKIASNVDTALFDYLDRMPRIDGRSAIDLLLPLAFAQTPGLGLDLWRVALEGLSGSTVDAAKLSEFARGRAANFLIETSAPGGNGSDRVVSYRLFHQALNDAMLRRRQETHDPVADQRALTAAFIAYGDASGWDQAPAYLLRALPQHAARGSLIDGLLERADYLMYADLRRLSAATRDVVEPGARERALVLESTPWAADAPRPADRAAMFSITETLERLEPVFGAVPGIPYVGIWAAARKPFTEPGFTGHIGGVRAICPITVNGREMLASGGSDGRVRIWDTGTGKVVRFLDGHAGEVRAVCQLTDPDGPPLLASGGDDNTVQLWSPNDGRLVGTLIGHTGEVRALCPVSIPNVAVGVATASDDSTIRLWDAESGETTGILRGHTGWIWSVCTVDLNGQQLLATAGDDATIRLWSPVTGENVGVLEGHTGPVRSICALMVEGQVYLASASSDLTVRLWNVATSFSKVLYGHSSPVLTVNDVTVNDRQLVASAGNDRKIRLWDPANGALLATMEGHGGWIRELCIAASCLVSASDDACIRLWRPDDGSFIRELEGRPGFVRSVCTVLSDDKSRLVAAAHPDGEVRLWGVDSGKLLHTLSGHRSAVMAVCQFLDPDGSSHVVSGSRDTEIRLWDTRTFGLERILRGHTDWVRAVCQIPVPGRRLLASAGNDSTVRIWDLDHGTTLILTGHRGDIRTLAPIRGAQALLASAGEDGIVRVWDPTAGTLVRLLEGHAGAVMGMCVYSNEELLATAGADSRVRLWDPRSGRLLTVLDGHSGWVMSLVAIKIDGRELLASSGNDDHAVKLWHTPSGVCVQSAPIHHEGLAMAALGRQDICVGLSAGLLTLRFESILGIR
jgi:WD40 repeat protein